MSQETMADQVKKALRDLTAASAVYLEEHLSLKSYQGRQGLLQTLRDLKKSGAVAYDLESRVYSLAPGAATIQDKIWRAAVLKSQKGHGMFEAADLAPLAGCTKDYARRHCGFLRDQGFLKRLEEKGGLMCIPCGMEKETPPHWNRRAQKRQQEAAGRTGKLLLEMDVALSDLRDAFGVLTSILQNLRAALPTLPEQSPKGE